MILEVIFIKIIKYKKMKNNQYLIEFEDNSLEVYEEVILKSELLLKKEITTKEYDLLLEDNQFWTSYYQALRYIRSRSRSIYEVRGKLNRDGYPSLIVDRCILKLLDQGYLNDQTYASSFFHEQLIITNRGPRKISDELRKRGIQDSIIDEVISSYDNEMQYKKVSKIVSKLIKSNKNKSLSLLQRKIRTDLLREGFSKEIIEQVIDEQEFPDDHEIRIREYDKIKKRLSKRYEGYELERKIKEQLMRKGFYL